jgi:hypothetical protein
MSNGPLREIKWEKFVDNLKDESGRLAKAELKAFILDAKTDSNEFIQKQGRKIERYLNQLASKKITKKQFRGYMEEIRDLTAMEEFKLRAAAKAAAQRLVAGIEDLILNGLMMVL